MKIAFIITAYNKPAQLIRLVNCLGHKAGHENIYVHIDKKADFSEADILTGTNKLITIFKKYPVYWGGFNQLQAILSLIEKALEKNDYDYVVLLSGQDLPVLPHDDIMNFFKKNSGLSFITSYKFPTNVWPSFKNGFERVHWFWFMDYVQRFRGIQRFHILSHYVFDKFNIIRPSAKGLEFYGGSDWWMLPGEIAGHCLEQFQSSNKIRDCFKYSFIPTEMFFHTVIGNSPYRNSVTNHNYRFIPWSPGHQGHPDNITIRHKNDIKNSGCLFARKFDLEIDPEIFTYFENKF